MIIQLDAALQEALDLLNSWEKSGKIPPPEELEKIDPLAAQIMRSHIFQDGKLQGREPIDNLVGLVFELSEAITLDRVHKDPEKWLEQAEQKFRALDEAFKSAAKVYLLSCRYSFAKKQLKKVMKPVRDSSLILQKMCRESLDRLASPPQIKGDLADRVSGILRSHCPEAKSYTIASSTKELLEGLGVLHIESEAVRKRLDRKAKPKAR